MLKISDLYFLSHHLVTYRVAQEWCPGGKAPLAMMSRQCIAGSNGILDLLSLKVDFVSTCIFKSTIFLRTVISQDFSSYFSIVNLSFWRKSTIFFCALLQKSNVRLLMLLLCYEFSALKSKISQWNDGAVENSSKIPKPYL